MPAMFILAMKGLLTRLAVVMISEKFVDWAFFKVAELVVKSTDNPHDDEWLKKLESEYYGSKE